MLSISQSVLHEKYFVAGEQVKVTARLLHESRWSDAFLRRRFDPCVFEKAVVIVNRLLDVEYRNENPGGEPPG